MKRFILVIAPLLLVTALSFTGISELEERDQFCTSCHLAPETTYYNHATAVGVLEDPFDVPDLATFHYWDAHETQQKFHCIDCHRGDQSLGDRAAVLLLAAGDTVTWVAGKADETVAKGNVPNVNPQIEVWQGPERFNRRPDLLNAACLSCHQDTLTLVGFENHFHNRLPEAAFAYEMTGELQFPDNWHEGSITQPLQTDETIIGCLDCHRAHVEGFESEFFLDQVQVVFPACVQCHKEVGQGPLDLAN